MDVFLILYVLGLMVLFFFLGTAIGGAAHSFKSFIFGRRQAAGLAEAAVAGAAIAGTAVATELGASNANEPEPVKVTSDELVVNPADEWAEQNNEPEEQFDLAADISRDETAADDNPEIYEQALPLTDSELPSADEFSGAEVYRNEDEASDQVQEIIEHVELQHEAPIETDDQQPEQEFEPVEQPEEQAEAAEAYHTEEQLVEEAPEPVIEEIVEEAQDEIVPEAIITSSDNEQRFKKSEAAQPLVWDYTNQTDDYSDIVFLTEGEDDDLTNIRGITTEVATALNELGLRRYDQIAALTGRQVGYLKSKLGFTSQLNEQVWIEQAKILASGGVTAFVASQLSAAAAPEPEVTAEAEPLNITEPEAVTEIAPEAEPEIEPEIEADANEQALETETVEQAVIEEVDETEQLSEQDQLVEEEVALEEEPILEQEHEQVSEETFETEQLETQSEEEPDLTEEDTNTEADEELSLAAIAAAGLTAQAASDEFTQDEQPETDHAVPAEEDHFEDAAENQEDETSSDELDEPEQSEHQSEAEDNQESERSERRTREEHRLFGEKERIQRDEEWRNRYQRERVIQPRDKSTNHEDDHAAQEESAEAEIVEEVVTQETAASEADFSSDDIQTNEPEIQSEPETDHAEMIIEEELEQVEPEAEPAPESAISELSDGAADGRPVDSDDLKQIEFISTGLEKKLNLLGVYKLSQIANWSPQTIADISEQLEFRSDKIINEDWMGHAQRALDLKQENKSQDKGGLFSASDLIARLEQLDKITDLTEHEKTLLSNNGITELSQIANWSGADINWAKGLLEVDNVERVEGWVETASSLISSGKNDIPGGPATGPEQDLKRIRGVDEDAASLLNGIGVNTYSQIAEWQQKEMDRINDLLGTSGRVEREYWVVQAKVLKDGGATDFSKLYDEK